MRENSKTPTENLIGSEYVRAQALANAYEAGDAFFEPPPERKPHPADQKPWQPKLGPIGTQVLLNRSSTYKFLYGERGSMKTGCLLHDLILHCYQDARPGKMVPLAVICTLVRSAATEGGAWEKLNELYLPEWKDGIGLDFSPPKQDDQKNRFLFIGNKYGSWSRVVLKSIPYGENISARLRGIEPSFFFFDEITLADDPKYFLAPSQQLRRPTGGPRQFVCAGNPSEEGEEHWTWQLMVAKEAEQNGVEVDIPEKGGRLKGPPDNMAVYYMPISENVHWTDQEKQAYQAIVIKEAGVDPTAEARLLRGLWVARPKGNALFKNQFIEQVHVRGDYLSGRGIVPIPGFPVFVGYDLGQVYNSITFVQYVPAKDKNLWLVFDEIDHLGERIKYKKLAWEVIERMRYWTKMKPGLRFFHVADESALNQYRPGSGSFDALDFEREFNRSNEKGRRIKMIGCPKGSGSVPARVRMLQEHLDNEEILLSAMCRNTRSMLLLQEEDDKDPEKPRRGKWIHKFDSLTYPMFRIKVLGDAVYRRKTPSSPSLTFCGSGA